MVKQFNLLNFVGSQPVYLVKELSGKYHIVLF